ncbi:MAG: hypothetical protein ACI4OG_01460, partial [Bacilli bacterium]
IGWSTSKNATTAEYKVGSTITLTKNTTFYAITKKNTTSSSSSSTGSIKMTRFSSNQWKVGTYGDISLTVSPSNATYTVTSSSSSMRVTKNGSKYRIMAIKGGTATITAKSSTGATDSMTFTVVSTPAPSTSRVKKGIKSTQTINGTKIYVEEGCPTANINKYLTDIKEVPSYVNQAKEIFFLTKSTFYNVSEVKRSSSAVGQTLGANDHRYVDVLCDKYYDVTIPHELAHTMDMVFAHMSGKSKPSARDEWTIMRNKYNMKILRSYSFDDGLEFFADAYTYYFRKNVAKTIKTTSLFNISNNCDTNAKKDCAYPDELKDLMVKTLTEMSKYTGW